MSLSLTLLGTSASRPTVERNVSSIAVAREGETLLFDCGEGTQRQMMRYGVSFALDDIFFTHFHADHVIGLIGLLRTLALQGRTETMRLWGPVGAERMLRRAVNFGADRLTFSVDIAEVEPNVRLARTGYDIVGFPVSHGPAPAIGYALVEPERKGRFDPEEAARLGVPEGPLWGQLHRGLGVTLPDGRTVTPERIVGEQRPGRRVVITGDTRPCPATIEAASDADLLVHEATFSQEEADRARETGHSTAREAAEVARDAGVRRLVLTHISARYSRDAGELEREAKAVFANTRVGKDGLEIDVPFRPA
jgi:ribonuclease Z